MLLLFATPLFAGFANVIMPLQIGAPDVAFPRLNVLAYWLYLFGGMIAVDRLPHPERCGGVRLVRVRAAVRRDVLARARRRPVGLRPGARWFRHDPRRRQLHHDDHLHAGARHDDVPDAAVHLERADHERARAHGLPGARRRAARARRRPPVRCARVRPGERRGAAVAAPVLVLRPSRGLHHRVAVLRDHLGDPAGVQPQADVRLQGPGLRDHRHRRPLGGGLGAPHVRHRARSRCRSSRS